MQGPHMLNSTEMVRHCVFTYPRTIRPDQMLQILSRYGSITEFTEQPSTPSQPPTNRAAVSVGFEKASQCQHAKHEIDTLNAAGNTTITCRFMTEAELKPKYPRRSPQPAPSSPNAPHRRIYSQASQPRPSPVTVQADPGAWIRSNASTPETSPGTKSMAEYPKVAVEWKPRANPPTETDDRVDYYYPKGSRLFISFSQSLPKEVLSQVFSQFGPLESVYLLKGKNFGFAKYQTVEAAQLAIEQLNNRFVQGSACRVSVADAPPRRHGVEVSSEIINKSPGSTPSTSSPPVIFPDPGFPNTPSPGTQAQMAHAYFAHVEKMVQARQPPSAIITTTDSESEEEDEQHGEEENEDDDEAVKSDKVLYIDTRRNSEMSNAEEYLTPPANAKKERTNISFSPVNMPKSAPATIFAFNWNPNAQQAAGECPA